LRNQQKKVGHITGAPGKLAENERVEDGPVVVLRRGNSRGARGPCCSARLSENDGRQG